jgi:hypothetical protein
MDTDHSPLPKRQRFNDDVSIGEQTPPSEALPHGGHGDTQEQPKVTLDSLPTEIIIRIAFPLTTPELGALRRTCRKIEAALFNDFAKEFFRMKQFMLTEPSLQCLVDISNHPKLKTCLEHVIIGMDKFGPIAHSVAAHMTPAQKQFYFKMRADHDSFLILGQDKDMLTRAFRNLPNLRTVRLVDAHRWNSARRPRDGPSAHWRSYGNKMIQDETNVDIGAADHTGNHPPPITQFAVGMTHGMYAARAFLNILHALGIANARPENLEIFFRDWGGLSHALSDTAFRIPTYSETAVVPVLAGLKTCLLTVNPQHRHNAGEPDDTVRDDFRRFLEFSSNIEHLRLNFPLMRGAWQPVSPLEFFKWLADGDIKILPKLTRLDFGMVTFDASLLLRCLAKFKNSLTTVSLWKVKLSQGLPEAMWEDEQERDEDPEDYDREKDPRKWRRGCWGKLIPAIIGALPKLERLDVGALREVDHSRRLNGNGTLHARFWTGHLGSTDEEHPGKEAWTFTKKDFPNVKEILKERLILPQRLVEDVAGGKNTLLLGDKRDWFGRSARRAMRMMTDGGFAPTVLSYHSRLLLSVDGRAGVDSGTLLTFSR